MRAGGAVGWALAAGLGLVGLVASAGAQPGRARAVRLVDEAGVTHFTNDPCQPRYRALVPELCAEPEPTQTRIEPAPVESEPVAPALASPGAGPPSATTSPLVRVIEQAAVRHGVDPRLVEAVIQVESAGDAGAISPKGALGLMQLMPARAATLGVRDPFDPVDNVDGGVRHLRHLLVRYGGNLRLALAAYNAGEEAVRAHGGVPPYRETRDYVQKVLRRYGPVYGPGPLSGPERRSRL